ncbi:MAG: PAS domain S-box protein [Candidatus Thorarchaeota archaeon]|jgi:PAS domain S-box-containing protein
MSTTDKHCLESIPFPIIEVDKKLRILFLNKKAKKLLGVRSSPKDAKIVDFVTHEYAKRFKECLKRLKSAGDTCIVSLWLRARKDQEIPVKLQASVVSSEGGVDKLRFFIMEPSPTKPLGSHLQIDDELLSTIIGNSHDGLIILGDDYIIEYVSERGLKLFGTSRNELIGNDFRDFISKDVSKLLVEHYRRRRKGETPRSSYSVEIARPDGNNRVVEIHADVVSSPGSGLKSIMHLLDITEQEQYKAELEDSERRNRAIVENMYDGLAIDNKEGNLVFVNDAFCQMLGFDKEELVGKSWVELTPDKNTQWVQEKLMDRMNGKSERYELWWVRSSGEMLPTIVSATPYFTPEGEFLGSFATITDISELKETEETVQFYLDLLTHDVANQLQVIMTSSGLLDNDLPNAYIMDAQGDILDAVERCNRLITKVKRAGQLRKIPLESVNLAAVLREKAAVLERVYGASVHVDKMDESARVHADVLLGELLWNLLENAARHNPKTDRQVWVTGKREAGMFKLSIADNGPGISRKRRKTLFDRTKRQGGVGLTLILQMARKYGGRIELEDRVKGKPNLGTKFVLWLHESPD